MPNHRAIEWVHTYGRRYPAAWTQYAQLLAAPPSPWPRWCFCPLAGAYAVVSNGAHVAPGQAGDVGALGALAAWRCTQGIYRMDATLLAELWETPVRGELPVEVLERLPEWCVYVETPHLLKQGVHGFFAHLEFDANTERRELRLVLDTDEVLVPFPVHLSGSLETGVREALVESRIQALRIGAPGAAPSLSGVGPVTQWLEGFVSVLLYLCADDAEIGERPMRPASAIEHKRKGPALLCPSKPITHDCGTRLGAELFAARERYAREQSGSENGRSVLPHVRRAHWHSFWTGPKDAERSLVLRWLSPILVAMSGVPETATVRTVGESNTE